MSDKCQSCESARVIWFGGKISDRFGAGISSHEHDGYVLGGMNIGGGDYIEIDMCLDCGRVQGQWPVEELPLERGEPEE
jgi:hypothetical protein